MTHARRMQIEHYAALGLARIRTNAECDGAMLEEIDGEEAVARIHIAEALSYRGETLRRAQVAS